MRRRLSPVLRFVICAPIPLVLVARSWSIKRRHFDVVIFFRKGSFFELFEGDAEIGAQELGLKVSSRGRMRLAGVPLDSFAEWAKKLIEKVFWLFLVCLGERN